MLRFISILTFSFITLITMAAPAKAQIEIYDFDKAHTQILFFADHLGFSKSQGKFLDYEGQFTFDRTKPEDSSVEITIKTNSIDMDHERWDKHMKSDDFFDVESFPEMAFKSTAIEVTGEKTANITGDLTILGITKPVTLKAIHNKSGKHPFNQKYVSGFSATATLDRSEWGMEYGLPLMKSTVELSISVEGVRQGGDVVNP